MTLSFCCTAESLKSTPDQHPNYNNGKVMSSAQDQSPFTCHWATTVTLLLVASHNKPEVQHECTCSTPAALLHWQEHAVCCACGASAHAQQAQNAHASVLPLSSREHILCSTVSGGRLSAAPHEEPHMTSPLHLTIPHC